MGEPAAHVYPHAAAVICLAPDALCEAMAAGVAPVVTDWGSGVPLVIREGIDGVIVTPRRRKQFAAALHALMGDDATRSRIACAPEVVGSIPISSTDRLLHCGTKDAHDYLREHDSKDLVPWRTSP